MSHDPGQPSFKKIDTRAAVAVEFGQLLSDMSARVGRVEAWRGMALAAVDILKSDEAVADFIRLVEDCHVALKEQRRNQSKPKL